MNQKNNQGYQKTHQNIKDCLNRLLQKKKLDQITIQELCLEAGVNRSTFYAHFQDIYDVLAQIGEDLNEVLLSRYRAEDAKRTLTESDYICILFEHCREYSRFYRILLSDPHNPVTLENVKLLQQQIVFPVLDYYQVDRHMSSYIFRFIQAGFFAVIKQWLDEGCPESTQQMAEILLNLRPSMPSDTLADAIANL